MMSLIVVQKSALVCCLGLASLWSSACGSAPLESNELEEVESAGLELSASCPAVDPSIAVPSDQRLSQILDARGVQIYVCQEGVNGYGWAFQAPEADLTNARGRLVGVHYAGPTWEYRDGSKVVAARVAGVSPDPTSIPWLLLKATAHEGRGRMDGVTYIQRLDTLGGLAPAAESCSAANAGEVARVDYLATYYFYEAGRGCGCK